MLMKCLPEFPEELKEFIIKNSYLHMKIKLNSYTIAPLFLLVACLFFILVSFVSSGSLYGGDSYAHYLIAKYAFAHPLNFLDHWGKPLFTLLSSPFAYFGFHGMLLFNILVCFAASYIALLTARKLKYNNLPLVVVFSLFAPIFILLMFSGLTEAVFSLFLIAGVYLFIDRKFIVAAILISFIPFVRSEGLLFLFWFSVLLLFKKQYKAIPFLLFGVLFYSILGGLISGDFLWLITNNPYKATDSIYGHGTLFYYFTNISSTFGMIVFVLSILGLFAVGFQMLKRRVDEEGSEVRFNELFLISFSAVGYFVFHSVVWWKGWLSVLGDARFMAAIVPLVAIIALKGFNTIVLPIKNRFVVYGMVVVLAMSVVFFGWTKHTLPAHLTSEDVVVNDAVQWIKEHKYEQNLVVYYNPIVPVLLDKDPYDNSQIRWMVPDCENPEKDVPSNTIFIWDGHFSAWEGKISLQKMKENQNYQMLKLFEPAIPFTVFDTIDYKVAVFIRK